jgi:hypothetical protein
MKDPELDPRGPKQTDPDPQHWYLRTAYRKREEEQLMQILPPL